MQSFWLTFTDGSKACCQGANAYDAKKIAEHMTGKKVAGGEYRDFSAEPLPYPADPCIWKFEHPIDGPTPCFCFNPRQCAGNTSCPQPRSCTE